MSTPPIQLDIASITRRVEESALVLNTTLTPEVVNGVVRWIHLITTWNRKIDLTAARTPDELVDLCVADALVLSREIGLNRSVIDVGSGAGAPGLPLAVIRPDLNVTLVEPLAKRVSFLRTTIGTLGARITVVRGRGEALVGGGKKWDVAVSRATLEPTSWLRLGVDLSHAHSGIVAVLLARSDPPVCADVAVSKSISYTWPLTKVQRTAVLYHHA